MKTIADIMFSAMEPVLRNIFEAQCREYETNSKYSVKKFYEDTHLAGFCVYHDEEGIRYVDEAHHVGKNVYVGIKMWKFLSGGAKTMRMYVHRDNEKMLHFYTRIGFSIIGDVPGNYLMERGG